VETAVIISDSSRSVEDESDVALNLFQSALSEKSVPSSTHPAISHVLGPSLPLPRRFTEANVFSNIEFGGNPVGFSRRCDRPSNGARPAALFGSGCVNIVVANYFGS
jgi:hypothetical protein